MTAHGVSNSTVKVDPYYPIDGYEIWAGAGEDESGEFGRGTELSDKGEGTVFVTDESIEAGRRYYYYAKLAEARTHGDEIIADDGLTVKKYFDAVETITGFELALNAPTNLIYDGKAKEADITAHPDSSSNDFAIPILGYYRSTAPGSTEIDGEMLTEIPSDVGNYVVLMFGGTEPESVPFTITPASLSNINVAQQGTLTYTGAAQTPVVTASATAVNDQDVTFTFSKTENGTYGAMPSVTSVSDGGTFYYKASAPNHEDATGSFTVTVKRADQTAPAAPTKASASAKSITLTTVAGCEYSKDGINWQTSPVFTGLEMNTSYTFYQRRAADDNHNVSPSSAAASISTGDHEHNWSYAADGQTITATCGNADGGHGTPLSYELTIAAPTMTTYGGTGSAEATLTGLSTFNSITGLTVAASDIKYVGRGSTTYSESSTAPTAAGTYKAKITVGGKTASVDYEIGKAAASVAIAPAAKSGLTYSGEALELVTGGSVTGGTFRYAVTDKDADQPSSITGSSVPAKTDAGTYRVWYKVAGDANHSDSAVSFVDVTIAAKSITITAKDQAVSLNEAIAEGTDQVIVSGLVEGHVLASITLTASGLGASTSNGRITPSDALIKKGDSDVTSNYNITYVKGTLAVNKIAAVLTKVPDVKVDLEYDGSNQALLENNGTAEGGTLKYAIGNANGSIPTSWSSTIPTVKNAGDYVVWIKVAADASHYDSPAVSRNIAISRCVATVSGIKAKDKVYDATTDATMDTGSISITGKAANDNLGITAVLEFDDAEAGDNKDVSIRNITLTGSSSANYVLLETGLQTSTKADITKRSVTVKALDQTVSLGGTINDSVSMAQLSGQVSGHTLYSVSLASSDTSHKTASGTITPDGASIISNGSDVTDNYLISYTDGNLVVLTGDKAKITAAPEVKQSLSYNGAEQDLLNAGTADGGKLMYAVGGNDTQAPASGWAEEVPAGINAGEYHVWYMVEGDEDHDDLAPACLNVTIGKREVTVTALDQTVSLNGVINSSVSMASLSGAVSGHTIGAVSLASSDTDHVTENGEIIPSAAVIKSGTESVTTNYTISYVRGTLKVTAADAKVTTAPAALHPVYNAEAQKLVSTNGVAAGGEFRYALGTNGDFAPSEGYSESIPAATDAGDYYVWYMVEADTDHVSTTPACIDVTIAPAPYAIRYDKNDGSGSVTVQNETIGKAGDNATISVDSLSRNGFIHTGWNDKADGSGRTYADGDEYIPVQNEDKSFADLTLYAQWTAVSLNSISINKAPDKTHYFEGENFDPAGMVVLATYTDESTKEVTGYTYTPSGNLALTDDKITVSYTEGGIICTAVQSISVSANEPEVTVSLNSISINKAPDKTQYLEGESFDPAGMVVVANYTDNTSKEVTGYTYTPSTNLALTDDKVTVSYTEDGITCSAIQKISVSANEPEVTVSLNSISITTPPTKTEYIEGEKFDPAGMAVTATYTDGSTSVVTGYICAPDGELTLTDDKITVSYTEGDITATAEQKISVTRAKTEEEEIVTEDEDYFIWNLYEDSEPKTFRIKGVSVNAAVANSNSKSSAYYTATLSGNTLCVSVKGDLKSAAKAENTLLEFKTADGVIEYNLPVEYKKPDLKLSAANVTIRKGTKTKVHTTVLYKTAGGNYEPLDLSGVSVKYNGKDVMEDGVIAITASDAEKGTISITGDGWNASDPVELKFSIKAVNKDVITVDLGGAKNVVINKNAKDQRFELPVYLNGETAGELSLVDKAGTGLASYADGVLTIAYPADKDLKAKTYTITLSNGSTNANVKVKVSDKQLAKSITLKVQSKYDVVTGQKMVIVPALKDVNGEITDVSITDKNYSAVLNEAGNIVVDYKGNSLNIKNLKMGDLTFKLKISDVEDEVFVTVKNVKAKKSAITVKAAKVCLGGGNTAAANLICSYKDGAGNMHLIAPVSTAIDGTKGVVALVSDDPTVVNISNLTKKSGSVKLKLTFPGGLTKKVTVKVTK